MTSPGRDVVLARFARGDRGFVVVGVREYRRTLYVDLRLHAHTVDGRTTPTDRGITIKLSELPKLIAALVRGQHLVEKGKVA